MERLLTEKLKKWKSSDDRKPLILWGARQVGKTWIMQDFGEKCFENTVYVSFYNNRTVQAVFEKDYSVKRIISELELLLHVRIVPKKTLIIFDEVQNAPKVLESLKYFCEEGREYAVVAAGSLLGVALHQGISFPVGKVNELRLYPMNFKEYLMARGESGLAGFIDSPDAEELNRFKDRYTELLREYMVTGGMPEVVKTFCKTGSFSEARKLQLEILQQYEGDFGKHISPNELARIRMVWNAIPMQLAKENRKFFFGQVKKGARMGDFELAIQWLTDAGLVFKVNKVEKPAMPLKAYVDFSAFKLFMLDTGLMGALSELDIGSVLKGNSIFTEFKGAMTEQYVLQQLLSATDYTPYYYSGEKSTYETDFLIQKGGNVIPLEVKAEENLHSKSLRAYYDKFSPVYAIRTSMAGARNQEWMVNIPLWAIGAC